LTKKDLLRDEITFLGEMLGDTIREKAGKDSLQIVEDLRRFAWDRRSGLPEAESTITRFISSLHNDQLQVVVRAFTVFLDLMNLAEDRQRVRVLRERERNAYPDAPGESIREAILRLKRSGMPERKMQQLLDQLHVEMVFTAHPTEAKRRSVRGKLRSLRGLLNDSDLDQLPKERERTLRLIRAELAKLWQTDFIRPWRPSVMQEVQRGLSIKPVLWDVLPQILREFRNSLTEAYSKNNLQLRSCVKFGSWIGGDRDGHPDVTTEITEQTIVWLRQAALDFHLAACGELFNSFTLSQRQVRLGDSLPNAISTAFRLWPHLEKAISGIPPAELCRRWLGVIYWRLGQTQLVKLDTSVTEGAYSSSSELMTDVALLENVVSSQASGGELLAEEVQTWLDRIHTFGFHLAQLDVRQDGRLYRTVLNELFQKLDLCAAPEELDETERQQLLTITLRQKIQLSVDGLSAATRETLDLFQLLHRVVKSFGIQTLGGHVISMTNTPSDVLTVLWLWRQTTPDSEAAQYKQTSQLPIIPLFETIGDLQQGPAILAGILDIPEYREYLRQHEDHQIVMLGYSDSTKDGGYLSACWSLYKSQQELDAVATDHGIELTFFHGRGGSLGRGGGPAARGILSLPVGTFHGSLRLTEQGEVLADRYDDPIIAHRHLEQVVWSSLLACGEPTIPDKEEWANAMETLADASFRAYRKLIEQPRFVEFFRRATPISEIEQLRIGSRPSRRQSSNNLADLRAIPWVFSWTQCRCLIPAWYGFGTAATELLQDTESRHLLQSMYRDWNFFRATIDNAELALAKTDLGIAVQYASLADDSDSLAQIGAMISNEFLLTRGAILAITGNNELLDGTPWLKESIRLRDRYIDPLNLIQVELLRRLRSCNGNSEEQEKELRHLMRLTINGLAAGMRTSG